MTESTWPTCTCTYTHIHVDYTGMVDRHDQQNALLGMLVGHVKPYEAY